MHRTSTWTRSSHGVRGVANFFNSGVSSLKHASFPAAGITPVTAIPLGNKPKSFFASLLGALHDSRRLQARRVLRQYHHLISHGDQRSALPQSNLENRDHVDQ